MDYYFWVVQGPDTTIVVDTGFSEDAGRKRGRTLLLDPAEALAQLGIDPEAIEDVIVTHGHYDHIGNLGLFPNARIHMAEAEYRFWTSPTSGHIQFSFYSEEGEIDQLRLAETEGRLKLFSGETSPVPGIRLVEVGGHTPGQAIVYVPTSEGEVLLASDAVHFYEELERDMPFTAVSDLPTMYDAFAFIRREKQERGLTVIPGHDPDVLTRFRACPDLPAGAGVVIGGTPSTNKETP
ncbi:N-acyl homoserine lactonase family protein [Arthrobacter sp. K5]|uniref:N-acyl homoserine lactonase family protein n=1 Tax=Arthrobacter sp. K5 TaxID=2839623 RepID=A0AAU8EYE4_9MICC